MATTDVLLPPHSLYRPSLSPRTPRFNADHSQEEPLLRSSSSPIFPHQPSASPDELAGEDGLKKERRYIHSFLNDVLDYTKRIPRPLLVLIATLLLLIAIIYNRDPDLFIKTSTSASPSSQVSIATPLGLQNNIDYSNYTDFPLSPKEYATECWKQHQLKMKHRSYWSTPESGIMDVPHSSSFHTCSSTITFQLDSDSGLLAQMALLAQAAALARAVRSISDHRPILTITIA